MASSSNVTEKEFMDTLNAIDFNDPTIYHDRVLVVEGKKFYVLKEVLSFSFEYFRGLFTGNFAETNQQEIELPEVSALNFKLFLDMLYPVQYRLNVFPLLNSPNTNILLDLVALSFRFMCPAAYREVNQAIHYEIQMNGLRRFDLVEFIHLAILHDLKSFKGVILKALQDPVFAAEKKDEIMNAPEHVKDFVLSLYLDGKCTAASANPVIVPGTDNIHLIGTVANHGRPDDADMRAVEVRRRLEEAQRRINNNLGPFANRRFNEHRAPRH